MKISKAFCLFIVTIPSSLSCSSYIGPRPEDLEKVKIENAIAFFSEELEYSSIKFYSYDNKKATALRWYDSQGDFVEALKSVEYQEIDRPNNESSSVLFTYGNGEDHINLKLYSSLDYLVVRYPRDMAMRIAERYYQINIEDGKMLSEVASRIEKEYSTLLEEGGDIEDYKTINKPKYLQFQFPNKGIKTDYDHKVFDKIKTMEHIEIIAPIEEKQYLLSYDIYNGYKIDRDGYCWSYYLFDDYTTVRLDFFYKDYTDNKKGTTKERSYYYQVNENEVRELIYIAETARTVEI